MRIPTGYLGLYPAHSVQQSFRLVEAEFLQPDALPDANRASRMQESISTNHCLLSWAGLRAVPAGRTRVPDSCTGRNRDESPFAIHPVGLLHHLGDQAWGPVIEWSALDPPCFALPGLPRGGCGSSPRTDGLDA